MLGAASSRGVRACGQQLIFARAISFYPTKPKWAQKKVTKTKKILDLGWDQLKEPLDQAPLALPKLRALKIEHGKLGAGQAGARKFKPLMPALRWQNPEVNISMRLLENPTDAPKVTLELDDGVRELDAKGKRSEEILAAVLEAAGAPPDDVERSVQWAADFLKDRPLSAKAHEMKRSLREEAEAEEVSTAFPSNDDAFSAEFDAIDSGATAEQR